MISTETGYKLEPLWPCRSAIKLLHGYMYQYMSSSILAIEQSTREQSSAHIRVGQSHNPQKTTIPHPSLNKTVSCTVARCAIYACCIRVISGWAVPMRLNACRRPSIYVTWHDDDLSEVVACAIAALSARTPTLRRLSFCLLESQNLILTKTREKYGRNWRLSNSSC